MRKHSGLYHSTQVLAYAKPVQLRQFLPVSSSWWGGPISGTQGGSRRTDRLGSGSPRLSASY
eukprot:1741027-Pyramimonas_sp.AAC.2